MADCHIIFDDSSLSRYQCTFFYENHWMLADGDGQKPSTNGTWLFAESFFEIFDGMSFKVGETIFKSSLSGGVENDNGKIL